MDVRRNKSHVLFVFNGMNVPDSEALGRVKFIEIMAEKCPYCGSYNTYTSREKSTFNTVACFVADAAIGIAEKVFFPNMPHHGGFSDCEDNKYTTVTHCRNCGRTS